MQSWFRILSEYISFSTYYFYEEIFFYIKLRNTFASFDFLIPLLLIIFTP